MGLSSGTKRWPIGERDGHQQLVVYRGLVEALLRERPEAVAAHWGVPIRTAASWQRALNPAAPPHSETEPVLSSSARWMATPVQRQFSLLDLVYWTLWAAVLFSLVRLMYGHTVVSDKWHITTMCLAAALTLSAAWGYSTTIQTESAQASKVAVVVAAGVIGLLLIMRLFDAGFSETELVALALGIAALVMAGFKIGSRKSSQPDQPQP